MDPLKLSRHLDSRFRDYLATTFYFRDEKPRGLFREALDSGSFSQGTYIEGRPVFKLGATVRDLFSELLGRPPNAEFLAALRQEPLFAHQEAAIRTAYRGENVLVASGTSSGKTESFIYPVLLSLYEEFISGSPSWEEPGVRALILYPMNALANDQKDRLGRICKALEDAGSSFSFTFGEYTGSTPEHERDRERTGRNPPNPYPGEMVYRRDMRRTPPHILLTNYSMLEFLLIRPEDSPLFDDGRSAHWRFIVVDEAHQYLGIRGTEIGMLMRRLKQRLSEGGRTEPITCIATSATIVGRDKAVEPVCQFAETLFGEEFSPENVLLGETIRLPLDERFTLDGPDYLRIRDALTGGRVEELRNIAREHGLTIPASRNEAITLAELLLSDKRCHQLIQGIQRPIPVRQLAQALFPGASLDDSLGHFQLLVDSLAQARTDSGEPLVTVRYHHFLKGLEGAFVLYYPELAVSLDRGSAPGEGAKFEVALCEECGQHYLAGRVADGHLVEAIRDPADEEFGVTYFLPLEESAINPDSPVHSRRATHRLCTVCSRIVPAERPLSCGHDASILVAAQQSDERNPDEMAACPVCDKAGRDPVKEIVHGSDGPHAVIATCLHQSLPDDRRRVLAFADGRQEAAFFAWYAERTYNQFRTRSYLREILQEHGRSSDGLSTTDLAVHLSLLYRDQGVVSPAATSMESKRVAHADAMREILSAQSRLSLEGLGLMRRRISLPRWLAATQILTGDPLFLNAEEADDLLAILLDMSRFDAAVEIPQIAGSEIGWDEVLERIPQKRYGTHASRDRSYRNWAGPRTRRVDLVARLLVSRYGISWDDASAKATTALVRLFEHIVSSEGKVRREDRLFIPVSDGFVANLRWWRFHAVREDDVVYSCVTCGRVSASRSGGVCIRFGCRGLVEPVRLRDLPSDHYRTLYMSGFPAAFRSEEHTAQIAPIKAKEYQDAFKDGDIHLLSSSTTFELGVDLGDLDTVFLRNVPPQPFNYVQRVGRAGRRTGRPGFSVTYCRRSPHDLYHFARPERMMEGLLEHPPVAALTNTKIMQRHMNAFCVHKFLRAHPHRSTRVGPLLGDYSSPTLARDVSDFLRAHSERMQVGIKAFVPGSAWEQLRLSGDSEDWIENVCGRGSSLAEAEKLISDECIQLDRFRKLSEERRDYASAAWADNRLRQVLDEDAITALSRACVIPKYGFPVDVVPLEIYGSKAGGTAGGRPRYSSGGAAYGVELQRDLSIAISEYAPGSTVIANKKQWQSRGLKMATGLVLPRRRYRYSSTTNTFETWREDEIEDPDTRASLDLYLVPRFGFVTGREPPKDPARRPYRMYTSRPFFARTEGPSRGHQFVPSRNNALVQVQEVCPGTMVEICEGRKGERFWVCPACGAGERGGDRYPAHHTTPWGEACAAVMETASLAHEFITDIVELRFLMRRSNEPFGIPTEARGGRLFPTPSMEESIWFSYGLAYAILNGFSRLLSIPPEEVNVTVRGTLERVPVQPIVVYDNVPGGAGLVAKLEEAAFFKDVLAAALDQVSGACGCGPEASCYGCLRSYRNQFAHDKMKRGPVKEYLEQVLERWG